MWRTSRSLRQRNPAHPIFKAPGVSIYTLCLDILHVLDLGFSSHCIGNVCFDFVVCKVPAAQRQLALKKLWAYVQEHQGEAGHGKLLSKFTLNFTKPKALSTTYPCLAHLKAAQDPWHHKGSLSPPNSCVKVGSKVRTLVPVFSKLCRDWCDGSTYSLKRKDLLAHLDMYYNHVYDSGLVPEKQEARAALGHMEAALQTYQFLAAKAVKENSCQWSMVPKLHYCNELAIQGLTLNPRYVWCYGSEDFVGRLSELGSSCLRGVSTCDMPFLLSEKLDVAMTLQLGQSA